MLEVFHGIETEVVAPDGNTPQLIIRCYADVVEFWLKNKKIFSGDWNSNFKEVIEEMRCYYSEL